MKREKNQYIFAPDEKKGRGRRFLKAVVVLILLLILVGFVVNFIMTHQVVLEERKITILNLPDDLDQYSILHISNLHGDELGDGQKRIASALDSQRYSCVVMTGDMLGEDHDVQPVLDLIGLMPADTLKIFIPGDSDGSIIDEKAHNSLSVFTEWAEKLKAAGVVVLDTPYSVTRGKGTVWFVPEELYTLDLDGLYDVYRKQLDSMNANSASLDADEAAKKRAMEYRLEWIEQIREIKKQIKPEDIQIVLTHTPLDETYVHDVVAWAAKDNIFSMRYASLILAGHYNGGQWRIPFAGAVYVPELGWFPEDSAITGLSYPDGIPQYISPGLGNGDKQHYPYQPGRLFNSPTITLITLTPKMF